MVRLSLYCLLIGLCTFGQNMRLLDEFGDISSPQGAQAALDTGLRTLLNEGGGMLLVPANAPPALRIENWAQTDRNGPGVTVIDTRGGFVTWHLPPMGKHKTGVWAGSRLTRTVNTTPHATQLPFQGVHSTQSIQNYIVSGSSSYMAGLARPVKAGKDARLYPDLIRGIYVGQYLTVTSSVISYSPPYDRIIVSSIGWDDELQRNYFTADLEHDHEVGHLVYNKHVVNGLQIEGYSNSDNQSMELQITRRHYGVGDSFTISGSTHYMSDVFSGFGDEGAITVNAEVVGDLDGFHGTVESIDWEKDELVYAPGKTMPHTLSPSRPLINMNEAKWITSGKVRIMNHYRPWQGQTYPNVVGGPGNVYAYQGGAIIGDADCPWTREVVGRFFAVTEPTEVLQAGDGSSAGGYAQLPSRPIYRWYRINRFEELGDGSKRIHILRVRWSAVAAGSPKLFLDDNYTWHDHDRPLAYAIAPGAWVYDISRGWADTLPTGGHIEATHPRTLKLTAHGDRGTAFDFAAGDAIEQPPGPDPWHPVPIRIRTFDQLPTTMDGASFQIENYGRVQTPSAIMISSLTRQAGDLERRKDAKPAYGTILRVLSLAEVGLHFQSPMRSAAILFEQTEGNEQRILWRRNDGGTASLFVAPATGDFMMGGDVNLTNHSLKVTRGISGTTTASVNLRGISVTVPAGESSYQVRFSAQEPDATYAITAQPSWFTRDRLTEKRPDGFVIEFETPAPVNASFDWHLIR